MRKQIELELGTIDVLVANAGGGFAMPGPLEETTEEAWHSSADGNLTATFLTLKSVLPAMKQRKSGVIVTISSAAGRKPHPQAPIPYSAAKAGIQILTQDLAAQAGPYGIRVNCIAPETILTERNRQRIRFTVPLSHPPKSLVLDYQSSRNQDSAFPRKWSTGTKPVSGKHRFSRVGHQNVAI